MLQPRPGIQKVRQSLLCMNAGHEDRHPLAVARRGTSTRQRGLRNINTERGEDNRLPQPQSPDIFDLGFGGCVNQCCCSQVAILVEHPRHLFLEPFLRQRPGCQHPLRRDHEWNAAGPPPFADPMQKRTPEAVNVDHGRNHLRALGVRGERFHDHSRRRLAPVRLRLPRQHDLRCGTLPIERAAEFGAVDRRAGGLAQPRDGMQDQLRHPRSDIPA